jgi:hypothetical protein
MKPTSSKRKPSRIGDGKGRGCSGEWISGSIVKKENRSSR